MGWGLEPSGVPRDLQLECTEQGQGVPHPHPRAERQGQGSVHALGGEGGWASMGECLAWAVSHLLLPWGSRPLLAVQPTTSAIPGGFFLMFNQLYP